MNRDQQIKHMVDRFLGWKLPENFNPDGGISFKKSFNENTPHPMKHEPTGTNLFDATQAEEMVRYMLEESQLCGIAEAADTSMNEAIHPIAKTAESSQELLSSPQRIARASTVAELEKILNEPEPNVEVMPDGRCRPIVSP